MAKIYIDRYSELWRHTVKRVIDAEKKSKNYEEFARKMVTRLKRITHEEKIHYAIEVLRERNHHDIVDVYEGRLLMDEMVRRCAAGTF